MSNGWICLHRSLVEWEWFGDAHVLQAWIWLLLNANSEDKKWRGRIIKRGQKLTSKRSMAEALGVSDKTIQKIWEKLKSTGEIEIESDHKWGSTITIVKYDQYQTGNLQCDEQGGVLGELPSGVVNTPPATPLATPLSTPKQQYNNITITPPPPTHAHARTCGQIDADSLEDVIADIQSRNAMEIVYLRSQLTRQQVDGYMHEFIVEQKTMHKTWRGEGDFLQHLASWMQKKADIIRRQEKQDKHYGNNKQQTAADALIAQSETNWRAMASIQGTDDSIR